MELITTAARTRLGALHPEALAELTHLEQALDATPLDAALLSLTQDYVAAYLRQAEWPLPPTLSARDRACLAYAEQFMLSVSTLEDAQVSVLRDHMSPDEIYLYANAVYLIEMSRRLDLTLEAVLS